MSEQHGCPDLPCTCGAQDAIDAIPMPEGLSDETGVQYTDNVRVIRSTTSRDARRERSKAMDKDTFAIVAEIDCLLWMLNTMLRQEQQLSVLAHEIDKATGFDKANLKRAKSMMRRVKYLQSKLGKETGDE